MEKTGKIKNCPRVTMCHPSFSESVHPSLPKSTGKNYKPPNPRFIHFYGTNNETFVCIYHMLTLNMSMARENLNMSSSLMFSFQMTS